MAAGPDGITIGVVDVGLGNVGSVMNMFRHIGVAATRASEPADIEQVDRLLLPGVGHFDHGMRRLVETGMADAIRHAGRQGVPVLGICLGMQLLTEGSEEGAEPGLGMLPARCRRLVPVGPAGATLPVPHMGWNDVNLVGDVVGLDPSEEWRFYFAHSFAVSASSSVTLGTTDYGGALASLIGAGRVLGAQFHPEKSHRFGMRFLQAWSTQPC